MRYFATFTMALMCSVCPPPLRAGEPMRVEDCLTNSDLFIIAAQVEPLVATGWVDESAETAAPWLTALMTHRVETVYLTMDLTDITPSLFIPLPADADDAVINDLQASARAMGELLNVPVEVCEPFGGFVYLGSVSKHDRLLHQVTVERLGLTEALASSSDNLATLIVAWSPDQRRVVRELFPTLPEELGGIDALMLADHVASLQIAIPASANALQLEIVTGDEETATRMGDAVESWIDYAVASSGNELAANMFLGMFEFSRATNADGCQLTWASKTPVDQIQMMVKSWMESATGTSSDRDHLMSIGIAMHNFHHSYGSFPPSASYVDGQPLLSWRVYLLPYLDQMPLYERFHLDEAWDSPHNMSLLSLMPDVYESSNSELNRQGMTRMLVPVADEAAFHGELGVPILDLTDGTSNTLLVAMVPAEHAVPWTKPADWEVDFNTDLHAWLFEGQEIVSALFGDGSVHRLETSLTPENLTRILKYQDGEPVEW